MQKEQKPKLLRITVYAALLSALSIVFGKYLAFNVGEYLRFSFENLPIIFAGLAFGPIIGALVGTVADLLGCLLVGYAINPMITVGAAVIGLLSGFVGLLIYAPERRYRILKIVLAVSLSHLVGSVILKSIGLAVFYDMPLYMLMLWRLLNYAIVGALEGFFLYHIYNNKGVRSLLSLGKRDKEGEEKEIGENEK